MTELWTEKQLEKPNKVLSEKQLAIELGLSPWTVRTLRLQSGLPHFRTAGRVFYRLESILAWMDKQEKLTSQLEAEVSEYGTIRKIK